MLQLRPWTRLSGVLLAAAGLGGCGLVADVCTADIQFRVSPTDTTLSVGQRVTARAEILGCGGSERLADRVSWSSEAPEVAQVHAATGEITAVGPGRTEVVATGERYGRSPATVQVDVQ